jgi:hypothetical protein
MTIVNAAGSSMTDVTDDSQLRDVTDDQKPPGTRSYLTVGLPDPHPGSWWIPSILLHRVCPFPFCSVLDRSEF